MGLTIERERFPPADYQRFEQRLEECLEALGRLLERPAFGTGEVTVGAELELCRVDGQGRALPRNQEGRAETADPRVVLEIDRFNLELNLTPGPLARRPFTAMASELDQALDTVHRAAWASRALAWARPGLVASVSWLRSPTRTDPSARWRRRTPRPRPPRTENTR